MKSSKQKIDFLYLKRLFADASSLIILEKSRLIAFLQSNFEIYTIKEVKEETLKQNKFKNEKRYQLFEQFFDGVILYDNQKIEKHNVETDQKLILSFKEFLSCNRALKPAVLTDDKKIIQVLYKQEISFINALLVPVVLYLRKVIAKEQAGRFMDAIKRNSRYSSDIIDYAAGYLENN